MGTKIDHRSDAFYPPATFWKQHLHSPLKKVHRHKQYDRLQLDTGLSSVIDSRGLESYNIISNITNRTKVFNLVLVPPWALHYMFREVDQEWRSGRGCSKFEDILEKPGKGVVKGGVGTWVTDLKMPPIITDQH